MYSRAHRKISLGQLAAKFIGYGSVIVANILFPAWFVPVLSAPLLVAVYRVTSARKTRSGYGVNRGYLVQVYR